MRDESDQVVVSPTPNWLDCMVTRLYCQTVSHKGRDKATE